ncbi:hypothetical protein ABCR94_26720 [Streptomyces sp. 21So2-11]|uniref:hypothetical protein n=1 Tax=Streptomyces sp. 21So2-11 TaxID=3144408 RepID=UPI0032198A4F
MEPVSTALTSPAVESATDALINGLGLTRVEIGAGPAADAIALVMAYLNQSVAFLDTGHSTRGDIDTAMHLGCGLPSTGTYQSRGCPAKAVLSSVMEVSPRPSRTIWSLSAPLRLRQPVQDIASSEADHHTVELTHPYRHTRLPKSSC